MNLRTVALSALVAAAIGATAPAAAQANNQFQARWITEAFRYKSPDFVTTTGRLTFVANHGNQHVTCNVTGEESIENGITGEEPGSDETTSFSAARCRESGSGAPPCRHGQWQVTATGLPWLSHLETAKRYPEVWDLIEGVRLDLTCTTNAVNLHYEGLIRATVGENRLVFNGGDSEELSTEAHIHGALSMRDAEGNKITAGIFCVKFCH
jgi:hypothetical protein